VTFSSFLRCASSIASVLPTPTYGLMTLWQARSALQNRSRTGAIEAAKAARKGIDFLDEKERADSSVPTNLRSSQELRAALTALLATAQHWLKSETAQQTFEIADATFSALLAEERESLTPFLSDYLQVLVEFRADRKANEVAKILNKAASALKRRAKDGAPFVWLRAAMFSPTPRMVLDLGSSLLAQTDRNAAFEAFMHAAGLALGSNEQEVACEAIECAVAIFPQNADARRVRGLLRWRSRKFAEARQDFAIAVEADPDDLELRLALAHACLKLNDPKRALDDLDLVLSKDPDNLDGLCLYGEAKICMGEAQRAKGEEDIARSFWSEAIESLSKAIRRRPQHAASRRSRAMASYRLHKLEDALGDLDETLKLDPSDLDAHGLRVTVLLDLRQPNEALSAVNVALALVNDDPSQDGKKGWLMGLKGRALLQTEWPDQAIQTLAEATDMEPGNEEIAGYLIQAHKDQRNWAALVQCARRLESNPYSADFLLHLRKEEIRALRLLANYELAFQSMTKALASSATDPELVWLRARLLADIGDFERARDVLAAINDAPPSLHHLSLYGWVVQNLDSRDLKHRADLGRLGRRQYESALKFNEGRPNGTDVWLRKGLGNALLRSDSRQEAFSTYKRVIKDCEQKMSSASSFMFALIGWCYHCMEDHTSALRYYGAALDGGEQSVSVKFDSALVLLAARSSPVAAGRSSLDQYWRAIVSGRSDNILRRIGLVRVALHDVEELQFRTPELTHYSEIKQLLAAELRDAIQEALATPDGLDENVGAYLSRLIADLPQLSAPEYQEAFNFKMEGTLLLSQGKIGEALQLLQKAIFIYSRLNDNIWLALTWRDLASAYTILNDDDNAYEAASNALNKGLYEMDFDSSRSFIALATRRAASTLLNISAYQSLIRSIFLSAGPEHAYLDGAKLIAAMPDEKGPGLFALTVQKLFPRTAVDDDWMYGEGWKVPNLPNILAPLRQVEREGFSQLRQEVQALTVR